MESSDSDETSGTLSSADSTMSDSDEDQLKSNTSTACLLLESQMKNSKGMDDELLDLNAEEEQDEVVQAIIKSKELYRNHPPIISLEDYVVDICFHPEEDLIALANIMGDVLLYKYSNEETQLVKTLELHLKACRDVEFSDDGKTLFSTSKDLSIMLTDMESEKLIRLYEKAHDQPVYCMTIIDENMFATGDDDGTVKLWDLRQKNDKPIFSLKEMQEYVSGMITNNQGKYLVCTSGDGSLTTINIRGKKLHVQSEQYEEELTCLGLFKSEKKVLTATGTGKMYMFNWGEFGLHSDEFPSRTKKAINCMVPITEDVVITGGEDGILRSMSLFPYRQLGVVGQHNSSVEALDINKDGTLIASSSHDNEIKFWNVQYFEILDINDPPVKGGKQKQLKHNLPSSKVNNASDFFSDL